MKQYTKRLLFLFIFLLLPSVSIGFSINTENNFLVISDIHLDHASSHSMDISPSEGSVQNDLDQPTFEKLIAEIDKNIKKGFVAQPKFIIILGDIVGHLRIFPSSVIKSESVVFNILKKTFPLTPIFYTFGNNDSLKKNYGPFKDADETSQYKSPYDVAKINGGWLNGFLSTGKLCGHKKNNLPCIMTEDTTNGYYSAYLQPKFRLISLNSVLFSPKRTSVAESDAMNQLQWFKEQLNSAHANQESVLVIMHIPPGNNVYDHSNFWLPKEQVIFLETVKTYQHTIIGILASHTHAEELKIIQDENKKNISGIYFVASLSTSHGNEPSIKTFYFSKENEQWLLSNYEAFHFSMNHSNMVFHKLYDYKNYYCNNQNTQLLHCLNRVTEDKMKKYFSAGNQNYSGIFRFPKDIVLVAGSCE